MTDRERDVLTALLAVVVGQDADALRAEAATVLVRGGCPCGCPSVDFVVGRTAGMELVANGDVVGTGDGLFLYTVATEGGGRVLGGIEWVGTGEADPAELPAPEDLTISATAR